MICYSNNSSINSTWYKREIWARVTNLFLSISISTDALNCVVFVTDKGIAEDKLALFVERIFDRNRRLLEYKNIVLEIQFRLYTFLQSFYFCIFTARQWNSIASVYFSILGISSSLIIQFNRDSYK